jgi:hypothetical protein
LLQTCVLSQSKKKHKYIFQNLFKEFIFSRSNGIGKIVSGVIFLGLIAALIVITVLFSNNQSINKYLKDLLS